MRTKVPPRVYVSAARAVVLLLVLWTSTMCKPKGSADIVHYGDVALALQQQEVGSPLVRITVTNNSLHPIGIAAERLPWRSTSGFVLRSASCDDKRTRTLSRIYPIDDPPPGVVTILPRASVSEDLDLRWYFKDIGAALHDVDVCLFWQYDFQDTDGHAYGVRAGRFLLRRR